MVAIRIKITQSGPLAKPHPSLILDTEHMSAVGRVIAEPLRVNLAAGRDADGRALAPEKRGDGVPGHETGALAASIKARRTKRGRLVVAPDYKRFPYGIYLAIGVSKRGQEPRPFMGMSRPTLDKVANANAARFKDWVENINPRGGLSEAPGGLVARPGGLSGRPGAV